MTEYYAILTAPKGYRLATRAFPTETELRRHLDQMQGRGTLSGFLWDAPSNSVFANDAAGTEVCLTAKQVGSYRIEIISDDPDAPSPAATLKAVR